MLMELKEHVMQILADQKPQKASILSLERYKWHHIGLTVSAIMFAGFVLIGVGGMYFSLDSKISDVETKLDARISAVEDQMQAGFAELKVLILENRKAIIELQDAAVNTD